MREMASQLRLRAGLVPGAPWQVVQQPAAESAGARGAWGPCTMRVCMHAPSMHLQERVLTEDRTAGAQIYGHAHAVNRAARKEADPMKNAVLLPTLSNLKLDPEGVSLHMIPSRVLSSQYTLQC